MCGCALLNFSAPDLLDSKDSLTREQLAEFESEVPTRNLVRLETSVMSATASDKRIRDELWDKLDESGLMSYEDRQRLNRSGIRVGVSGGAVPWALASLRRGEQSGDFNSTRGGPSAALTGHNAAFGSRIAIPEGSQSLVELPNPAQSLVVPAGHIAGMNGGRELKSGRCLFELTPVEYGNGWVLIRFLPKIYYGSATAQYAMSANVRRLDRQQIHPLYEQQFEVKLHINETVVIGHREQDDWTVGRLLFQSDSVTAKTERLIALQLLDIEQLTGKKSMEVNYSKY